MVETSTCCDDEADGGELLENIRGNWTDAGAEQGGDVSGVTGQKKMNRERRLPCLEELEFL